MPGSRVGGERYGAVGTVGRTKDIKSKANESSSQSIQYANIAKFILIMIILLLISIPILMIRFNVLGVGEQARPFIEDLPYLNKILPEKPDPQDPKYMNKAELTEKYLEYKQKYEQLIAERDTLQEQLKGLNNIKENYELFVQDQRKLQEDQLKLQEEKASLEKERENFFKEIKEAKESDFKAYFEKIYPEKAAELYKEILEEQRINEQIKESVSYYENMDAKKAARIFEEMSKNNMDMVVNVLKNMDREQASEILANMQVETAAQISSILLGEYQTNTP